VKRPGRSAAGRTMSGPSGADFGRCSGQQRIRGRRRPAIAPQEPGHRLDVVAGVVTPIGRRPLRVVGGPATSAYRGQHAGPRTATMSGCARATYPRLSRPPAVDVQVPLTGHGVPEMRRLSAALTPTVPCSAQRVNWRPARMTTPAWPPGDRAVVRKAGLFAHSAREAEHPDAAVSAPTEPPRPAGPRTRGKVLHACPTGMSSVASALPVPRDQAREASATVSISPG
jgi:hypothetical protein